MNKVYIIGGRAYNISSPSIRKFNLAGKEFQTEGIATCENGFREIFDGMGKETLCKALSCLISGDLSLADDLSHGERQELVEPLCTIYTEAEKNFKRMSQIAERICLLAAKTKNG